MTRLRFTLPPAQVLEVAERKQLSRIVKKSDGTTEETYNSLGYFVTFNCGGQKLSVFLNDQAGDLPVPGMIATITIDFTEAINADFINPKPQG